MAGVTTGSTWTLLNYAGALYTASPLSTPFLTRIGGLNGGKMTRNFEFAVSAEYALPAAAQPSVTEDTSITAPAATDVVTTQYKNVCQINHKSVLITYAAEGAAGRITGIATEGENVVKVSKLDFQIAAKLKVIARDTEYSFLQGTYAISTDSDVANATRGLIECASNASNTVAAGGARLSKDLIKELTRTMVGHGAIFQNAAIICNAFQKQMITESYAYVPMDRNMGGENIKYIETDFGMLEVMYDPFQPTDTVTIAELSVCSPVHKLIPNVDANGNENGFKGVLFYEPLAKVGAAEKGQLYGEIGLDHGPYFMHGTITGLATS